MQGLHVCECCLWACSRESICKAKPASSADRSPSSTGLPGSRPLRAPTASATSQQDKAAGQAADAPRVGKGVAHQLLSLKRGGQRDAPGSALPAGVKGRESAPTSLLPRPRQPPALEDHQSSQSPRHRRPQHRHRAAAAR